MDPLDTELSRARADLRGEAARIADTESALADVRRRTGGGSSAGRPSRRWSPRTPGVLAAAAAVIALVVGLGVVAWDRSRDRDAPPQDAPPASGEVTPSSSEGAPTTTPSTASAPPTSAPATSTSAPATSTSAPATSTVPATEPLPLSVASIDDTWWSDAVHGWVTGRDADQALSTWATSDGGRTWTEAHVPAGSLGVRFADPDNGWADVDGSVWWSTHDGGATWTSLAPLGEGAGPDGLGGLAISSTQVILATAVADGVKVWTSPLGHDDFTDIGVTLPFGAGPVMDVSIAAVDRSFWVVYNDRTVAGSVAVRDGVVDTTWVPPAADGGGSVHVFAARAGGPLWALAQAGIWGGDMEHPGTHLFASDDLGMTFHEVPAPPGGSDLPAGFEVTPVDATTILAVVTDANGGVTTHTSTDGGASWGSLASSTGVPITGIIAAGPGTLVGHSVATGIDELWRSTDSGISWSPIVVAGAT